MTRIMSLQVSGLTAKSRDHWMESKGKRGQAITIRIRPIHATTLHSRNTHACFRSVGVADERANRTEVDYLFALHSATLLGAPPCPLLDIQPAKRLTSKCKLEESCNGWNKRFGSRP